VTQRSTVRRRISRYGTRDIAVKYIASNFSLNAQKRHPHIREASTKLFQVFCVSFIANRVFRLRGVSTRMQPIQAIFIENLGVDVERAFLILPANLFEAHRDTSSFIERDVCLADKWRCRYHRLRVHLHRTCIISQRPRYAKRTRCYFCVRVGSAMCRNVVLGE